MTTRTSPSGSSMRAVVLDGPGPASAMAIRDVPVPAARTGWTLIEVHAFGLNRSELHTRLGLAGPDVTFPRILGIEATGVVVACPAHPEREGRTAVAMMGGMGRSFDGGYAQYTLVPDAQVIVVNTTLDWALLGALPEVLQTAHGSLTVGVGAKRGDTVLVRGGTSSVGLMILALGQLRGFQVIATTRQYERLGELRQLGAAHALIDDGALAAQVQAKFPGGVDGAVELVGTPTLRDTLRCVRPGGTVCFSGMLSNQWTVKDFYPIEYIPTGVRLTGYGGDVGNLPASVLEEVAAGLVAGTVKFPIRVYRLEEIVEAHDDMEHNRVSAKQVVLTR